MSKEEIITKNVDYKRVAKFALFGAIGFGIGGLVLGLAFEAAGRVNWKTADLWESMPILLFPLFMMIAGAIGGIALGLILRRRRSCLFAFLMAIGFFPGMLAVTWILGFSIDQYYHIPFTTLFGLILGILLGLTLRSFRKFLLLSVAGALGGVVSGAIAYPLYSYHWYIIALQGVIGGAFLGGALGFLLSAEDEQKIVLEEEEEARKPQKLKVGEGDTFNYNTTKCPYCNSSTIEGGIIYQAKTEEERRQIGYNTKRQQQCLKCMAKWISVEK